MLSIWSLKIAMPGILVAVVLDWQKLQITDLVMTHAVNAVNGRSDSGMFTKPRLVLRSRPCDKLGTSHSYFNVLIAFAVSVFGTATACQAVPSTASRADRGLAVVLCVLGSVKLGLSHDVTFLSKGGCGQSRSDALTPVRLVSL